MKFKIFQITATEKSNRVLSIFKNNYASRISRTAGSNSRNYGKNLKRQEIIDLLKNKGIKIC